MERRLARLTCKLVLGVALSVGSPVLAQTPPAAGPIAEAADATVVRTAAPPPDLWLPDQGVTPYRGRG